MQHRQGPRRRLFPACLSALLAAPLLVSAAPTPPPPAPSGTSVTIAITSLRNHQGTVRACMTRDHARFPRCQDAATGYRTAVSADAAQVITFRDVTPGTYAIAVLHDENGNGRADRALGMMPREGFGFSRDAPVRMGPPSFEQAAIEVGSSPTRQTIRMRYML